MNAKYLYGQEVKKYGQALNTMFDDVIFPFAQAEVRALMGSLDWRSTQLL